jgi:hypothetical protein
MDPDHYAARTFIFTADRHSPRLRRYRDLSLDAYPLDYHGHDNMPRLAQAGKWYVDQIAQLLRGSGWEIISHLQDPGYADLLIRMGHLQYVVEVKRAAESRRDRIVPLLAEAILQAQAYAHKIPPVRVRWPS